MTESYRPDPLPESQEAAVSTTPPEPQAYRPTPPPVSPDAPVVADPVLQQGYLPPQGYTPPQQAQYPEGYAGAYQQSPYGANQPQQYQQSPPPLSGRAAKAASDAQKAMIFAILGFAFGFTTGIGFLMFGPFAWYFGSKSLENGGDAKVWKILGIVQVGLGVLGIISTIFLFAIIIGSGSAYSGV